MHLQTRTSDDVATPTLDNDLLRELRAAAAWLICAEAGEYAREGTLQPTTRCELECQLRCALAPHPQLVRTYVGYMELAILAGQILQDHMRRSALDPEGP